MRKDDADQNKTYFRSSDRFVRLNGDWYFSTREGEHGPYASLEDAKSELCRHIASQSDLKNFQRDREAWLKKKKAQTQPRSAMPNGLFALDVMVD